MANKNQYYPGTPGNARDIHNLWDRVNYLIDQLNEMRGLLETLAQGTSSISAKSKQLEVSLATVQDALTQGTTFAGTGNDSLNSTTQISGSGVGYSFSQNSAGVVTMTVSNPATARGAIDAAEAQAPAGAPATITLAKITPAGLDGSLSITAEGTINAFTAPT
jgi:hypothetical protein